MNVYGLDIPMSSVDCTIMYKPLQLEHTLHSLISSVGEFRTFSAAIINHYNIEFLFHQVPITAGGQKHLAIRSLPDTSTHDNQ